MLAFVNQYNSDNGTAIGVYPEAKAASSDLNTKILQELVSAGFASTSDGVYIQSFSNAALMEIEAQQADEGADIDLIALGYMVSGGLWYGTDGVGDLAAMAADGIDGLGIYIGSPGLGS